jgi:hypothetical protein
MISVYLAIVTYIIASTRIVTKDCQRTSSFHVYAGLVVIVIAILIFLFFHRYCFT